MELLEGSYSGNYRDVLKSLDIDINEGFMIHVKNWYRFLHDQIQYTVFLMSSYEQEATHLHLGRLVLEIMGKANEKYFCFIVAQQLNSTSKLFTKPEENIELSRLNLIPV